MEIYIWSGSAAGLVLFLLAIAVFIWRWQSAFIRSQEAERAACLKALADSTAAHARADAIARETQGHFQELLKGRKGYAIFTLDPAGRVQTWTREAEEVYGYPEAETRGRHISLFYPPAEASAGAADLQLANARSNGRIDDSGWRVRRDGKTFRARVVLSALRNAAGAMDGFWCLTEDLAGPGQSSSALSRTDLPLTLSPDGTRDVMIALAADGKITFLNRAFEKTTGLARRDWQGRPFAMLVHAGDWTRAAELLKRLAEGQSPPAVEVRFLAASGRHVAVELTATPIIADDGPRGCLLMARTSSALKATEPTAATEEPVWRSQKLEALGRLAGGVAHDFNNLLTVILGYADLLTQYGPDDHTREVAGEIQRAGERAAGLTRQLLAFSRKQILQPTILDLNELVRNLDTMLRRLIGEDVELTTALHAEKLQVKADVGQLEQALTNLVVNARDAMPKGGRLILSTAEVPASIETAAAKGIRGYAMLTVTDSGSGMDEDVLKRLFEPFFTTKEVGKGTGLGLAMVYGFVQQSGGRVEVSSELGRGSTFRVYLPLTDEVPQGHESPTAAAAPAGGKETILLVEDEEAVRRLASRTLQAQGYNVLEACDGVAALTLCQRHLRAIDIIVTDVVMPQLSGVDLVQRLKGVRPQLKVLYMSGYTDSMLVRHGIEESEANYLQKPFTPDLLSRKVRHLLDQHTGRN
jgi:two-component system, cell cycle sensor histidine kinase and response regulator CckA